jgi:hypothetical protein
MISIRITVNVITRSTPGSLKTWLAIINATIAFLAPDMNPRVSRVSCLGPPSRHPAMKETLTNIAPASAVAQRLQDPSRPEVQAGAQQGGDEKDKNDHMQGLCQKVMHNLLSHYTHFYCLRLCRFARKAVFLPRSRTVTVLKVPSAVLDLKLRTESRPSVMGC